MSLAPTRERPAATEVLIKEARHRGRRHLTIGVLSVALALSTLVAVLESIGDRSGQGGRGGIIAPTPDGTLGTTQTLLQVHPSPTQWLSAGLVCAPDMPAAGGEPCTQDLVLGGSTFRHGQWVTGLVDRFLTSWEGAPNQCTVGSSTQLVPGTRVIIVGCFNGGSDQVGFVTVLGFSPGIDVPQLLLSFTCGATSWHLRGRALEIWSAGSILGDGPGVPANPDFNFTWSGGGVYGFFSTSPSSLVPNASSYPSFCQPLAPSVY